MEKLDFTFQEILSLIGVAQCVYILVYMAFRAGEVRRAILPFLYFTVLVMAFSLDFARNYIGELTVYYPVFQWLAWFAGPPLSVLLIIQIARIKETPKFANYGILALLPIAYVMAVFMALQDPGCIFPTNCDVFGEWLVITGLAAGSCSMFMIWGQRSMLDDLYRERAGKDRYWLILTLVFVNLFFLMTMLGSLTPVVSDVEATMIRTFLGLGLAYLAATSLFRIYPKSLILIDRRGKSSMSEEEIKLAVRIERLIDYEKIYQEPAYGRAELARELEMPETVVSRVVNVYFGKSFPQILNERRVEDAKQLLRETDASVKIIADEVGFNSLASFNRVFRDLTGLSPTDYRADVKNDNSQRNQDDKDEEGLVM